jgi:hypothetical protein
MHKQMKNTDPNYQDVLSHTLNRMLDKGELPFKYNPGEPGDEGQQRSAVYGKYYDLLNHQYGVQFHHQGDFMVALLIPVQPADDDYVRTDYHIGVSKRNPTDPKVVIRGKSLALTRAFQNFVAYKAHQDQQPRAVMKSEEKVMMNEGHETN